MAYRMQLVFWNYENCCKVVSFRVLCCEEMHTVESCVYVCVLRCLKSRLSVFL